jgi:hypothetical protein
MATGLGRLRATSTRLPFWLLQLLFRHWAGDKSVSVIPCTCSVLALCPGAGHLLNHLHGVVGVQRRGPQPVRCRGIAGSHPNAP